MRFLQHNLQTELVEFYNCVCLRQVSHVIGAALSGASHMTQAIYVLSFQNARNVDALGCLVAHHVFIAVKIHPTFVQLTSLHHSTRETEKYLTRVKCVFRFFVTIYDTIFKICDCRKKHNITDRLAAL